MHRITPLSTALVGIGAGLTSALLFASVISGSLIAVVLFYAAALPVMIAAMGWSHRAGLVAAVAGAAVLGVWLGPEAGIAYALGVALPAWVLAYFALLGRSDGGTVREWFPVGSLVGLASLLGAGLGLAGALTLGSSYQAYRDGMQGAVEMLLREQAGIPDGQPLVIPQINDPAAWVRLLTAAIPPGLVAFWTLTMLVNLWLGARIAALSGRLARPWPDLRALRLPRWAVPALVGAVALVFLPGFLGLAGTLLLASLTMAFMVLGFSTLHALTLHASARPFLLTGAYLACVILVWLLVAVALLGLAEQVFHLRARAAARSGTRPANDNL